MSIFKKKKNDDIVPAFDLPDFDTAQGKKIMNSLIIGSEYPCAVDPRRERQKIIKALHVGSPIALVKLDKESSTLFAVDAMTGFDIGMLSEGAAEHIADRFKPGTKFVGRVSECGHLTGKEHLQVRIEYRMYW